MTSFNSVNSFNNIIGSSSPLTSAATSTSVSSSASASTNDINLNMQQLFSGAMSQRQSQSVSSTSTQLSLLQSTFFETLRQLRVQLAREQVVEWSRVCLYPEGEGFINKEQEYRRRFLTWGTEYSFSQQSNNSFQIIVHSFKSEKIIITSNEVEVKPQNAVDNDLPNPLQELLDLNQPPLYEKNQIIEVLVKVDRLSSAITMQIPSAIIGPVYISQQPRFVRAALLGLIDGILPLQPKLDVVSQAPNVSTDPGIMQELLKKRKVLIEGEQGVFEAKEMSNKPFLDGISRTFCELGKKYIFRREASHNEDKIYRVTNSDGTIGDSYFIVNGENWPDVRIITDTPARAVQWLSELRCGLIILPTQEHPLTEIQFYPPEAKAILLGLIESQMPSKK